LPLNPVATTLLDQVRTGLVAMVPSYRRPHHEVGLRS